MLINGVDVYEGMTFRDGLPKEMRKILGLPVTKPLAYYRRTDGWKKEDVREIVIGEIYDDWFLLEVNGVNIHSMFFAEMQGW